MVMINDDDDDDDDDEEDSFVCIRSRDWRRIPSTRNRVRAPWTWQIQQFFGCYFIVECLFHDRASPVNIYTQIQII